MTTENTNGMSTNRLRLALASFRGLSAREGLPTTAGNSRKWLDEIAEACHRLSCFSHRPLHAVSFKRRAMRQQSGALPDKQPRRFVSRKGEDGPLYYRSERLFAVGHRWYFATREGEDIGPYLDRHEAELALAVFVSRKVLAEPGATVRRIGQGPAATPFDAMVAELVDFFEARTKRSQTGAYVWALKRLQVLRSRGQAESHAQARTAALQYVMAESESPHSPLGQG